MSDPPAIVMIAGTGRSGSTLLERLLETSPRSVAVGELTEIWQRGLIENERCGCGEPFRDCPFWSRVGERAFAGWANVDPRRMLSLERRGRIGPFPLDMIGLARLRREERSEYGAAIRRILVAVAEESGAGTVIDSSKWPRHLAVLRRLDLRLSVVHLIRDPRAVAHSWTLATPKPHELTPQDGMHTYRPLSSAARWVLFNLLVDAAAATGTRTLRLTYDELARRPATAIDRVRSATGLQAQPALAPDGRTAKLPHGHGIAGNPMRFRAGEVILSPDERWRTRMSGIDKAIVTALCGPLWRRYRRAARA